MSNKKTIFLSLLTGLVVNIVLIVLITKEVYVSGHLEYVTRDIVGGFPFNVIKGGWSGDIPVGGFRPAFLLIVPLEWQFWADLFVWFVPSYFLIKMLFKKRQRTIGNGEI